MWLVHGGAQQHISRQRPAGRRRGPHRQQPSSTVGTSGKGHKPAAGTGEPISDRGRRSAPSSHQQQEQQRPASRPPSPSPSNEDDALPRLADPKARPAKARRRPNHRCQCHTHMLNQTDEALAGWELLRGGCLDAHTHTHQQRVAACVCSTPSSRAAPLLLRRRSTRSWAGGFGLGFHVAVRPIRGLTTIETTSTSPCLTAAGGASLSLGSRVHSPHHATTNITHAVVPSS